MKIYIHDKKATFSNWILTIFLVVLGFSLLSNYLFQDPTSVRDQQIRFHLLFEKSDINATQQVILKNKWGSFIFQKQGKDKNVEWQMISPRALPTSQDVLTSLISELGNMRIKKVFTKDRINQSNFSLNAPILELTLINHKNEKKLITQGLIRSRDDTYLMTSDKEAIYQVDPFSKDFHIMKLTDFIDNNIISFDVSNLKSLKLYRKKPTESNLQLKISWKENQWEGLKEKLLETEKVNSFLNNIKAIQSLLILDKEEISLQANIAEYISSPAYILDIETKDQQAFSFTISRLVSSLEGLNLEKRKHFIIKAKHRKYPYLISKDFFSLFQMKQRNLQGKKIPLKKLFY